MLSASGGGNQPGITACCAPESGNVRVFNLEPVSNPAAAFGSIGRLSEQPELPE